VVAEHDGEDSF